VVHSAQKTLENRVPRAQIAPFGQEVDLQMGGSIHAGSLACQRIAAHSPVLSAANLYLQEQFAVFAANFVRWAAHWLATQCPQLPAGWQDTAQPKVKEQVKVGAHTSAWVNRHEQGCLSRFTDRSVFAGRSLKLEKRWAVQLPLPFAESLGFGHS
jgi:hypothetical protein